MRLWEASERAFLLETVKHFLGFWVRLLFSWKVVPFLYIHALSILISGKRAFAGELSLQLRWKFLVFCVTFMEMFSVHYVKCILPTYLEWKIRQAWKFNILWASSKTKFSVLLNVPFREICLRYLLKIFPSVSLQKWYFMFLIFLNGQNM